MSALQKAMTSAFEYQMSDIYTAIPGVVVTVRNEFKDLYIDVQPSINNKDEDGTITERPVIMNVPVQMLASSTSAVIVPLNVGDPVFLIFSMRGLDTWKRGNGRPTTPSDQRKFDKRDCIAIPGPMPIANSTNDPAKHIWAHNPRDVTVVHNLGTGQEVEIRLKTDGSIAINTTQKVEIQCKEAIINSNNSVEVNSPEIAFNGNVTHIGNYTLMGTFTGNGIVWDTHKHSDTQPGLGTSGGPIN